MVKQKEAKICACYKLALNLLIEKQNSDQDSQKTALLTAHLSSLTLQPKHKVICIRMAIKAHLNIKNYGVASKLIQMVLPLNLVT